MFVDLGNWVGTSGYIGEWIVAWLGNRDFENMAAGMESVAVDDQESNAELVLFQVKECYVYMVRDLWNLKFSTWVELGCVWLLWFFFEPTGQGFRRRCWSLSPDSRFLASVDWF